MANYFRGLKITGGKPIYHWTFDGQSLSLGQGGGLPLSLSQPYDQLQLSARPDSYWPEPLKEAVAGEGEKPSNAFANWLAWQQDVRVLASHHGGGGKSYEQLRKGSNFVNSYGVGFYDEFLTQVTRGLALAGSLYVPSGSIIVHGEEDSNLGTSAAQYEANLVQSQADKQADVRLLTGDPTLVYPLLTDQCSSRYLGATRGQLNAALNNPYVFCMGPKYQFDYADVSHLINKSYQWLGEYHAKVAWRVMQGLGWSPLYPLSATRTGRVITVVWHVPVPPLVIDTANVLEQIGYGLEFSDNTSPATRPIIESVTVNTPVSTQITLSAVPTGGNQIVRYAATKAPGSPGGVSGRFQSGSLRGNLRDSDQTPSRYGNKLHNWACHSELPVLTI